METIRRFFEPPHESFFLFGPRGTGKSTLVKERFPDALYIDFLDPEVFRIFSARPEHLRERLLAATNIRTVIIDEIQKVPEMSYMPLSKRNGGGNLSLPGRVPEN